MVIIMEWAIGCGSSFEVNISQILKVATNKTLHLSICTRIPLENFNNNGHNLTYTIRNTTIATQCSYCTKVDETFHILGVGGGAL